jgi:ParB/RepB/Spo0J family partition protein
MTEPKNTEAIPSRGKEEVVSLLLTQVVAGPYQPRLGVIKKSDVADLMESIRATGQIVPIIVSKGDGENVGKYLIHSGHRRVRALEELGLKEVRATVWSVDERQARKMAVAANLGREDLSGYEKAVALRDYQEAFGLTQKQAAHELGIEERTARRLVRIINAPEKLRTVVKETGLSAYTADLCVAVADARSVATALRAARGYADGKTPLPQLKTMAIRPVPKTEARATKLAATLKRTPTRIDLKAQYFPKGPQTERERAEIVLALELFLAAIGVPEVKARGRGRAGQLAADAPGK